MVISLPWLENNAASTALQPAAAFGPEAACTRPSLAQPSPWCSLGSGLCRRQVHKSRL